MSPMRSQAQRRFLWAKHPGIAERWEKKTPKGKLPERVGKKRKDRKANENPPDDEAERIIP